MRNFATIINKLDLYGPRPIDEDMKISWFLGCFPQKDDFWANWAAERSETNFDILETKFLDRAQSRHKTYKNDHVGEHALSIKEVTCGNRSEKKRVTPPLQE